MNTSSTNRTWIWVTIIAVVGAQVLALLNQMQSLKINTSLFKDPGYNTLIEHPVVIPPVTVGRPNPFAPLPGFAAPAGTAH